MDPSATTMGLVSELPPIPINTIDGSSTTIRTFQLTVNDVSVELSSLGASITKVLLPDYSESENTPKKSSRDDVVLSYVTPEDQYNDGNKPFFGAIVGRVANRIKGGQFQLAQTKKTSDGNVVEEVELYQLDKNNGPNHLHGGVDGFWRRNWTADVIDNAIQFTLVSPDGDQGYPGGVQVTAIYSLSSIKRKGSSDGAKLSLEMRASLLPGEAKSTPIALAQHSYFNLSSHSSEKRILEHTLHLPNCARFTPLDRTSIPTREVQRVDCSEAKAMNFLEEKTLADALIQYGEEKVGLEHRSAANNVHRVMSAHATGTDGVAEYVAKTLKNGGAPGANLDGDSPYGFDHNYAISPSDDQTDSMPSPDDKRVYLAAVLSHPPTCRSIRVLTTAPGVQLYTSNYLDGTNPPPHLCKGGSGYFQWQGICLETQTFPDSIYPCAIPESCDEFGKGRCFVLRPGEEEYIHVVIGKKLKWWIPKIRSSWKILVGPSTVPNMALYKAPSLMTAHKVEKITALRRAEEQRVSELSRYSQQSRWLSNCAEKESTVDQVREANLKARQDAEEQQRKLLLEKQEARQREIASKELERRMVTEIHRQKTEQEKREREMQRICETSEELKELERKLKTAYVNKERAAQHQEAMLIRMLENDREQAIEEKMEYDRQLDIQRQEEREQHRRRNLTAQKQVLQKQMLAREEQNEKLKEEASRDKKMIDDIIAKINQEDDLDQEARRKKVEETRSLVAQFQNERRLHEEAIEKQQRQQEAEIQAYNEMMEQRNLKEEAEKKRADEGKKRRWKKVVEETQNQTQSKEEYDTLRNMLWEEELEAKQKKEEEEAIERRLKQKEDMMRENKAQIAAKKEMLAKMEQEEKELVNRMLQKFAQDEEDESQKEENRRLFKQRFMAEANQQRIERNILIQQEKEREIKEQEALRRREEQKERVIEEAKRLLLAKHAAQLKGFLPKV
ncbi:hypothetical protein ACHAWF_010874 [Thalassiosira exigua]